MEHFLGVAKEESSPEPDSEAVQAMSMGATAGRIHKTRRKVIARTDLQ
jgi:hypothetical protein